MAKQHSICILGGTGFVGQHLAAELVSAGHRVKVLTRYRAGARELWILPTLDMREANVHDPDTLHREFEDCDVVINLVGILNESGKAGNSFRDAHTELPRQVAQACLDTGVSTLLHMSALGADAKNGPSAYLRSKGAGEEAIESVLGDGKQVHWTVFRPSVIYGRGDSFVRRFVALLRLSPLPFFPLPGANARMAPVFVGDVARAFAKALEDRETNRRVFELCGPKDYTLRELVDFIARQAGLNRRVASMPASLARLQARIGELLPGKPLSRDNLDSLKVDSVCKGGQPGFSALGIEPAAWEAQVPVIMHTIGTRARYYQYRKEFRTHQRLDDIMGDR